ncbi:MAG: hypothetical protein H6711_04860 [Myxococcales bacterium]|nr:hypothetical protein [Myxococcales bacterium]
MSPREILGARVTEAMLVAVALLTPSIAAAALDISPCPAATVDDRFGPWRCDSIFSSSDFQDYWGNVGAIWGDTLVLGYAGDRFADAGELLVLQRDGDSWREVDRLPARGGGSVALRGDVIVSADTSETAPSALNVFVRDAGGWTAHASLVDDSWGPKGSNFVPEFALADDLIVAATQVPGPLPGCETAAAAVYRREFDGWRREATLRPLYECSESTARVAADGDRIALVIDHVAHIFSREDDGWIKEAVITPPPDPATSTATEVALMGDRLAMIVPRRGEAEGFLHLYRRASDGWTPETKIAFANGDWDFYFARVFMSGDRVVVATSERLGADIFIGSAYIYTFTDAWYLEGRVRTPWPETSDSFMVQSFDQESILARVQPTSEPYFRDFELFRASGASAPTTPLPNPCDGGACDDEVENIELEERGDGCGCRGSTGDGRWLALVVLMLFGSRRRARPRPRAHQRTGAAATGWM